MSKLTKDQINNKLISKDIILTGDFVATNKKSEFLCLKCNHKFLTLVSSIYYNKKTSNGCPECKKQSKFISIDELNKRLSNKQIQIINYCGKLHEKSKCKCLICSNIWETTLEVVFSNKHNCPKCAIINRAFSKRTKIDDVVNVLNIKNIKLLSDFTILRNKHNLQCIICKHLWKTDLNSIYYNDKSGCPKCSIIKREQTMLQKYGVRNAMQNVDMFEKQQTNSFKFHSYDIGKVFYQSKLEKYFLDTLVNTLGKEWFISNIKNGPRINYTYNNVIRKYYSDFYINALSLVVEIKSLWTYDKNGTDTNLREQNHAKWKTIKEYGYKITILYCKKDIDKFIQDNFAKGMI
jgi:hypothetical protein